MKPIVDGLENEYPEKLIIIRVNIQDPVGRELAPKYGFQYTPTFIFFDPQGIEQWRSIGQLDPEKVRTAITP